MRPHPRLHLDHAPATRPKVSVILIDWGVRESFHSLHYLNRQTVPRADYELIWLEFYDHQPDGLRDMIHRAGQGGTPGVDRWVSLGYPRDLIFHKHRLYNVGLLAARGGVCVICDSDAIFTPTFIEGLIREFERAPQSIVHVDQVRNNSHRFYPFNYPAVEDVAGEQCINWHGHTTSGLLIEHDRVHRANMGACLAARRQDLLAIGGADEHIDYLGYMCGPYELTFRLTNLHGTPETWLRDEYIYHTWHPNTSGINTDYCGPEDGRLMSLLAFDARSSFRVPPYQRSPLLEQGWGRQPDLARVLTYLGDRDEPAWHRDAAPRGWPDRVYWVVRDLNGHNLFCHKGNWYALPVADGHLDPARVAAGGYPKLVTAASDLELQDRVNGLPAPPPRGPVGELMHRFRQQPLSELPRRAWRKARRLMERVGARRAPWE